MTDRELLELAAKAAGIAPRTLCEPVYGYEGGPKLREGGIWDGRTDSPLWNPLTDDGDALRLAVKLKMNVDLSGNRLWVNVGNKSVTHISQEDDPYAATRRAIVRAAAEIGRGMA